MRPGVVIGLRRARRARVCGWNSACTAADVRPGLAIHFLTGSHVDQLAAVAGKNRQRRNQEQEGNERTHRMVGARKFKRDALRSRNRIIQRDGVMLGKCGKWDRKAAGFGAAIDELALHRPLTETLLWGK